MSNLMDLYFKYQKQIRNADLIEFGSAKVIGRLIRTFTGKVVNHTTTAIEMVVKNTTIVRRYVGEAVDEGYVFNYLSEILKNGYKGVVYWSELKPQYEEFRPLIVQSLLNYEGIPYDYKSLFKNAVTKIKIDNKQKDELFCSEALHWALLDNGLIKKEDTNGYFLVPGEFGSIGLWEDPILIYDSSMK